MESSLSPTRKEPPWIHTMTGRCPRTRAPGGVKTFRYRQFSEVLATPNPEGGCGQCGANAVAARIPVQGAAGCGGRQRSGPTGGAAYGMPRNASVRPAIVPRRVPPVVVTISPVRGLLGAAGAALAPATRAPAARKVSAMATTPSRTLVRVLPYFAMSVSHFLALASSRESCVRGPGNRISRPSRFGLGGRPQVLSLDQGPGAAERDREESNLQVGQAVDQGVICLAYDQENADDQLKQERT